MVLVRLLAVSAAVLSLFMSGCGSTSRDLPLDPDLGRSALNKALNAWVEGKKPDDLKPEIIIGDVAWQSGKALVSFEILQAQEMSDGTNLYIPVSCKIKDEKGKVATTEITYVVGTSPVVTIFPQQ